MLGGRTWRATPFIDVDIPVPDTLLGHTLQMRVLAADCAHGAHGGYVYVDAFGSGRVPPQAHCLTDLRARAKPGKVQLIWSDTGAPGYAIYRSASPDGPWQRLGQTDSRYSTWLDEGLQAGQPYYYSVRPQDAQGRELCTSGPAASASPPHWQPGQALTRPPQLVDTPPARARVGQSWQHTPQASDPDGDALTWRLLQAPAGMQIDTRSGQLSWPRPPRAGQYPVTLAVQDSSGLIASQSHILHVDDSGNRAPLIENTLPAQALPGQPLAHQVQASDPDGHPITYTLGTQAEGMGITESGLITWP